MLYVKWILKNVISLFQVGSLSIVCCLLKGFSAVYIVAGCLVVLPIAFVTGQGSDDYVKFAWPLFYALTNITVVSKCPVGTRKYNYPTMKSVSLFWMYYHSLSLVILTIFYSVDILPFDVATTRLSDPILFYSVTSVTLLMGPLSILFLISLKNTVKKVDKSSERYLWSYY